MARKSYLLLAIPLCGLSLLLGAPLVPTAFASSLPEVRADLAGQLAAGGPEDGAYVYDVTAARPVFSERSGILRPPASVEKLYTATTALSLLGSSARLSTGVLGVGRLAPGGVWEGNLYLRGGGDPTFGSTGFIRSAYGGLGASVQALARGLIRVGIRRVNGAVYGDESYLDPLRGEPSSGYAPDPFLEGSLSGLAFDRGATGGEPGGHAPAAFAARRLWGALRAGGVRVTGRSGAAPTPPGAVPLAAVLSPPLSALLGLTLPPSDNFIAETLLKDLGARFGGAGSTAAGAGVVRRTIASLLGIHPSVLDGSGLSPGDRTSPLEVARLLIALAPTPLGAVLREHLAVAGRSGTLARRMRQTGAAGRCQAKTGTLSGVSNLAGYCTSADGHLLAFAIFNDGVSTEAAHTIQDHIAITLADATVTAH